MNTRGFEALTDGAFGQISKLLSGLLVLSGPQKVEVGAAR